MNNVIPSGATLGRLHMRNHAGVATTFTAYLDSGSWVATPLGASGLTDDVPEAARVDFSRVQLDGRYRIVGWKSDFEPEVRAGYYLAVQGKRNRWHVREDSISDSKQALAQYVSRVAGCLVPELTRVLKDGKDVAEMKHDILGTGRKGIRYFDNVEGEQWAWIADRSEAICLRP